MPSITTPIGIAMRAHFPLVMLNAARCHRGKNRKRAELKLLVNGYYTESMKKNWWRGVIEVTFIIFLFYSNLLMGEFERSGIGTKKGLGWAMSDIITTSNFEIAVIAALIGYILFEFLRTKF